MLRKSCVTCFSIALAFLSFPCYSSDQRLIDLVFPAGEGCAFVDGEGYDGCSYRIALGYWEHPVFLERFCSGPYGGGAEHPVEGTSCGDFFQPRSSTATWPYVVRAAEGYAALSAEWVLCLSTGQCVVQYSENLGWMCAADEQNSVDTYVLKVLLDEQTPVHCDVN